MKEDIAEMDKWLCGLAKKMCESYGVPSEFVDMATYCLAEGDYHYYQARAEIIKLLWMLEDVGDNEVEVKGIVSNPHKAEEDDVRGRTIKGQKVSVKINASVLIDMITESKSVFCQFRKEELPYLSKHLSGGRSIGYVLQEQCYATASTLYALLGEMEESKGWNKTKKQCFVYDSLYLLDRLPYRRTFGQFVGCREDIARVIYWIKDEYVDREMLDGLVKHKPWLDD